MSETIQALVPDENLYPAVFRMLGDAQPGRVLDAPSGYGAFAQQLLERGFTDIHCVDLDCDGFKLRDRTDFVCQDVAEPLPFPDSHFDYVFSLEGLEHFATPWPFVAELCRVLKPGGRLFISTPNTFSVDARLKYLMSGYFPRFTDLMKNPSGLIGSGLHAHVSPIYFWQLNYFLVRGGVRIHAIDTNTLVKRPQRLKRLFEDWVASLIRSNIRRRGFPDPGVTSDAVLFGDCIIVEGRKGS